MKIIKGTSRRQLQFTSLDDLIAIANSVRIIDAFVDKTGFMTNGDQTAQQ